MSALSARPPERYWSPSPRLRFSQVLDEHGWSRVARPDDADVLIVGSPRALGGLSLRSEQLVNAIGGTEHMTRKDRLARLLRSHGLAESLQPETYLVDSDPSEVESLRSRALAEPGAVWIRKPVARGRGVGVEPIPDVCAWLDRRQGPGEHGEELVQRYIDNPLLLRGRKTEIRSYLLIAGADPLLALYHDGTVRLTSRPFVRGDWGDPGVHVTNTHRQKLADPGLWESTGHELKWTLEALGKDVLERGTTRDPAWIDRTLRPALITALRLVVRAAMPLIERRRGSFQLLGMDSMLTDDLEDIWLTEIQLGPGLSVDNPVKARVIPAMVKEAAAIVLEVRDRLRRGQDPRALSSRRAFQWVFAEPDGDGPDARDIL
jgi:hypothetical protein